MGRTFRHDKEWGKYRPKKKSKGRTKEKPFTNSIDVNPKEGIYYDDLEVEAYEKELRNRKRYNRD